MPHNSIIFKIIWCGTPTRVQLSESWSFQVGAVEMFADICMPDLSVPSLTLYYVRFFRDIYIVRGYKLCTLKRQSSLGKALLGVPVRHTYPFRSQTLLRL